MEILNAILAFTLSMVVFSALVTVLVELIQRGPIGRGKGLQAMIGRYFDDAMRGKLRLGIIANCAPGMAWSDEDLRRDFLETVTKDSGGSTPSSSTLPGMVARFFGFNTVKRLTVGEFIRRLAHTQIGLAISRCEDGNADSSSLEAVIHNLAHKFVAHGERARRKFSERARIFAVIVAILLAGWANIDVFRLFQQLQSDPAVVQSLLAAESKLLIENKVVQDALKKELNSVAEAKTEDDAAEARARLAAVRSSVKDLASTGLAIGDGYYPYCTTGSQDPVCKHLIDNAQKKCKASAAGDAKKLEQCAGQTVSVWHALKSSKDDARRWFFLIVLSGLLIGIGGPFWFNFYTGLSRWVGVLRGAKAKDASQQLLSTENAQSTDDTVVDAAALTASFRKEIAARGALNAT